MSESEALLEIASAIKLLAASIGSVNFTLWLFLLFKNMSGDNREALKRIAKAINPRVDEAM